MIAIAPPTVSLHTKEFAEFANSESGNQGVMDGAKALAMTAIDVLCQPDLRAAMAAAFLAEMADSENR
jgi:hypothetical protein